MRRLPLLAVLLLAACRGASVSVIGEAEAVGAKVLVDGAEAAVMEKQVYQGGPAGPKGKEYASARFTVPPGARRIAVVSADGRRLERPLEIRGEAYLTADFAKGELRD